MFSLKKIMLISILSLVSINIFAEFKDNKVTEEYFGGIWKYDSQNPAAKNLYHHLSRILSENPSSML